jgi:hypothetical protein
MYLVTQQVHSGKKLSLSADAVHTDGLRTEECSAVQGLPGTAMCEIKHLLSALRVTETQKLHNI